MELYDQGFLYVKEDLLRANLLIFPRQIETVGAEEVHLNVSQGILVKIES